MTVQTLGFEQTSKWGKEAAAKAADFARAHVPPIPAKELMAYEEGFRQGYQKALADLRLHNVIQFDYRR